MAGWIVAAALLAVLGCYLWWAAAADKPADTPTPTPPAAAPAAARPRSAPIVRRGNTSGRPATGPVWLTTSDEHLTLHGDTHGRYVLVDERSRPAAARRGRVPP